MSKQAQDTTIPPLTQKPILGVDATPDENYPIRILEAYRHDAQCNWEVQGLDDAKTRTYQMMNEHQQQRFDILSRAIEILQDGKRTPGE